MITKTTSDIYDEGLRDLILGISLLETQDDIELFIKELCSERELDLMIQRLEVDTLFREGMTYGEICQRTKASTATISNVIKTIDNGEGGLDLVIDKLNEYYNDGPVKPKPGSSWEELYNKYTD